MELHVNDLTVGENRVAKILAARSKYLVFRCMSDCCVILGHGTGCHSAIHIADYDA